MRGAEPCVRISCLAVDWPSRHVAGDQKAKSHESAAHLLERFGCRRARRGGAWILSFPPAPTLTSTPPIPKQEADATLTALKPPKRRRPIIAIIAINDATEATEATDYLMSYGILRRSDVADVVPLSTEPGPVTLYPCAISVRLHRPTVRRMSVQ